MLEPYKSLRESTFRHDNSFIADSPKVVNLLLERDIEVKSILATQDYYDEFSDLLASKNIPQKHMATKTEMAEIVGHKIHHNCMMHGVRPKDLALDDLGDEILILDGITSAENVGSIVRSCAALGVNSIIISKETPHPFNRRALRVSMGYASMVQTHMHTSLTTTIKHLQNKGYRVYAAEVCDGSTPLIKVKTPQKWALIMGHEGMGITQNILDLCDEVVSIEMQESVKSLNVGVAASLMMYQFKMKV